LIRCPSSKHLLALFGDGLKPIQGCFFLIFRWGSIKVTLGKKATTSVLGAKKIFTIFCFQSLLIRKYRSITQWKLMQRTDKMETAVLSEVNGHRIQII
ncbi:hypothetical protein RvY_03125, partial [Ramazzottius varieornatus]